MPAATVFDRFPGPPCATLLGWTLLDFDAAQGSANLSFAAMDWIASVIGKNEHAIRPTSITASGRKAARQA